MQELHENHALLVHENDVDLTPENLGIITSYHHISFRTANTCSEHLSAKSKMKSLLQVRPLLLLCWQCGSSFCGMKSVMCVPSETCRPSWLVGTCMLQDCTLRPWKLDTCVQHTALFGGSPRSTRCSRCGCPQVLTHASEFDSLPVRPGDDQAIPRLLKHAKFAAPSLFVDARSKANALLQAHFARTPLRGDLVADQEYVRRPAAVLAPLQPCPMRLLPLGDPRAMYVETGRQL